MGKNVLPLTLILILMIGAAALRAQTTPVPTEVAQLQKRALAHDAEVHPTAVQPTAIAQSIWVAPHEQLVRMQIANAINERQMALRRDTEKLFSLAAELKQNVDKTDRNILSMDVIKKAQEIEKLAKSVKDKMKEAY